MRNGGEGCEEIGGEKEEVKEKRKIEKEKNGHLQVGPTYHNKEGAKK